MLVCLLINSGKSLCFALLSKLVNALKAAVGVKIPASKHNYCHLSSYQSNGRSFGNTGIATKGDGNLESVCRGEYQLIFTSPEASSRFEPVSKS